MRTRQFVYLDSASRQALYGPFEGHGIKAALSRLIRRIFN
jgi:hypothetical protein